MRGQLAAVTLLFALALGCGGAPAGGETETEADVSDTPKPATDVSDTPKPVSEAPKQDPKQDVSDTPKQPEEHQFAGSWSGTWAGVAKIESTGSVLKFKGKIELTVEPSGRTAGTLSGRAPTLADYELNGRFTGRLSPEGEFEGEYTFRGSRHNPHTFEGKLTITEPDRAKGHLQAPADRVDQTPSLFKVTLERGGENKPSEAPTGHSKEM
jgi:hypothetical protein